MKLFNIDDIVMHLTTKKMYIINEENQSFFNVFRKEYNLVGNMNEQLNKSYMYSVFIRQSSSKQQLLQSVEEMTELNKEILKLVRYSTPGTKLYKDTILNITEELGDVYNALGSLVDILNIDTKKLDKDRHKKLIRYYNKIAKPYSTDYAKK
jgi:NTP pyrophosphatase (non-canonical NTP hydrolase)